MKSSKVSLLFALLACAAAPAFGNSDARPIDVARSTLTLYVFKTGLFSGFAHNHEIEAPIESGEVKESEGAAVELRIKSNKLRVLDPKDSEDTRAKIQTTMQGAEVLDVQRFPEIHFQSTSVEPGGTDHWVVHGDLNLHGQTHPISFEVSLKDGLYQGTALLEQSGFGITPIKIAGGTVKVKDEVKLVFSIALMK